MTTMAIPQCYVDKVRGPDSKRLDALWRRVASSKNQNTVMCHLGSSLYDGAPIIVLATGLQRPSINGKTGDMLQIYILRADMLPSEAVKTGADASICGTCKLRPMYRKLLGLEVECYVDKVRGPDGAMKSYQAGNCATVTPEELGLMIATLKQCGGPCAEDCEAPHTHKQTKCSSRKACDRSGHAYKPLGVRDGAYGDPSFVDVSVWQAIHKHHKGKRTSYSHDWQNRPDMASMSMASIDKQTHPNTAEAIAEAKRLGFRWYRVLTATDLPQQPDEIMCPEARPQSTITCSDCGLCNGQRPNAKRSIGIVIPAIK